ncbi:hypothetical protein C8F04DRAFT_1255431 [Mycena alexandri]|uniref:Uncharacterized protein n=1 Tax=Mycena alexandri TaxID=1745969 RepID=A0AAD6X4M6_9AGAR|nr:hypothetical protein C8F04DRAFT_1255431 [Mycena alexandri]
MSDYYDSETSAQDPAANRANRVFNIPDQNATPRTLRRAIGDAQKLLGDVLKKNKQLEADADRAAARKPRKGKGKASADAESGPTGPNSLGYLSVIMNLGKSFAILVYPWIDATVFSAKVAPPLMRASELWKPSPMSTAFPQYLTAAIYQHVPEKYHSLVDASEFPDFAANFLRPANAQHSTSLNTIKNLIPTLLATLIAKMKNINDPFEWQVLVLFPGGPEGKEISKYPPILYPNLEKNQREFLKSSVLTQALRCILFGPASINGGTPGSAVVGKMWGVQNVTFGAMSLVSVFIIFHCYWRAHLLRNPNEKVEKLEVVGATSRVEWQEMYMRLRYALETRSNQLLVQQITEFWHNEVFVGIAVPSAPRPKKSAVIDEEAELEVAMGAIDLGPDNNADLYGNDWYADEETQARRRADHLNNFASKTTQPVASFRMQPLHKVLVSTNPVHPTSTDYRQDHLTASKCHLAARHNKKLTVRGSATSRRLPARIVDEPDNYENFQAGTGPRHQASGYRVAHRGPAQNNYDDDERFQADLVQRRQYQNLSCGAAAPGSRDRHPENNDHHRRSVTNNIDEDDERFQMGLEQGRRYHTVGRGVAVPPPRRPVQDDGDDDNRSDDSQNFPMSSSQDKGRRYQNTDHRTAAPVLRRNPAPSHTSDDYNTDDEDDRNFAIGVGPDQDRSYPNVGYHAGTSVLPRRPAQNVASDEEDFSLALTTVSSHHSAQVMQDAGDVSELDESLSAPIRRRPMPRMRSRTVTHIEDDEEENEHMSQVQLSPAVSKATTSQSDGIKKRLETLKVAELRDIIFTAKAKIVGKSVKANLVKLVMENEQALERILPTTISPLLFLLPPSPPWLVPPSLRQAIVYRGGWAPLGNMKQEQRPTPRSPYLEGAFLCDDLTLLYAAVRTSYLSILFVFQPYASAPSTRRRVRRQPKSLEAGRARHERDGGRSGDRAGRAYVPIGGAGERRAGSGQRV